MVDPTQALLLSTIATDPSDWHIGRFSLLGEMIRSAGLELDSAFDLTISDYPKDQAEREALAQRQEASQQQLVHEGLVVHAIKTDARLRMILLDLGHSLRAVESGMSS